MTKVARVTSPISSAKYTGKHKAKKAKSSTTPIPKSPPTATARSLKGKVSPSTGPQLLTAPSQRDPSKGYTLAIQVTPSAPDTTASIATLKPHENPYVYTYKDAEVTWKGKRYRLTLEVPLEKSIEEYRKEEDGINKLTLAAKKFAAIFLQDLIQQLDAKADKCPITPGQNFSVLFDKDQGYLAFTPPEDFDPVNTTRDDIVKTSAHVAAENPVSVQLSKLIADAKPEQFEETLAKPEFRTLQDAASRAANVTQGPFQPIGLKNFSGVSCFLNAAFQQWMTNPIIREELLSHPSYFKKGGENPLYKAMKNYVEHQKSGSTTPYSLQSLAEQLVFDTSRQEDIDAGLNRLKDELDFDSIPRESHLRSNLKTTSTCEDGSTFDRLADPGVAFKTVTLTKEKDQPIEKLLADQVTTVGDGTVIKTTGSKLKSTSELYETPPGVLTVYINRTTPFWTKPAVTAETIVKLKEQGLTDTQLAQIGVTGDLVPLFKNKDGTNGDNLKLAQAILDNGADWETICKVLGGSTLNKWLGSDAYQVQKDPSPVAIKSTITLPEEVCGEKTEYELINFGHHEGLAASGGHYVAYAKEGNRYWKISDVSRSLIPESEFLEKAKTASSFTFNRKGISSSSTPTETTKEKKNKKIGKEQTLEGGMTFTIEEGDLTYAGSNFALVNPTDETLSKIHPDIEKAETGIKEQIVAAKTKRAGQKWRNKDQILYSVAKPGKTTFTTSYPDVETTTGSKRTVLHLPLNQSTSERREADIKISIKAVLKEAQKNKIKEIAFPLLLTGIDEAASQQFKDNLLNMQSAIEEFAKENKTTISNIAQVKIVLTKEQNEKITKEDKTLTTPSKLTSYPLPAPTAKPSSPVAPLKKPAPTTAPATVPVKERSRETLNKKTTLIIEETEMPKELTQTPVPPFGALPSPDKALETTLREDLEKEFKKKSSDSAVLVDFTKGYALGQFRYQGATQENYEKAAGVFYKVLEELANKYPEKEIEIRLTLPKEVHVPKTDKKETPTNQSSLRSKMWNGIWSAASNIRTIW